MNAHVMKLNKNQKACIVKRNKNNSRKTSFDDKKTKKKEMFITCDLRREFFLKEIAFRIVQIKLLFEKIFKSTKLLYAKKNLAIKIILIFSIFNF